MATCPVCGEPQDRTNGFGYICPRGHFESDDEIVASGRELLPQ